MSEKREKAVVLLSGGIDSSTVLAFAKSKNFEIYALTFDYNQKHKREIDSAEKIASFIGVEKHLIIDFNLREFGGSALTSDIEVPKERIKVKEGKPLFRSPYTQTSIPITYVPARNTIFLSFALAWAEVLEAENIFIGANTVDYSGYPDCRPEYLSAFEKMANLATKISVEGKLKFKINAPFLYMKKSEIIKTGIALGIDYSLTWSCYEPQFSESEIVPCKKCDSCIFRRIAFSEAGIEDPLLK